MNTTQILKQANTKNTEQNKRMYIQDQINNILTKTQIKAKCGVVIPTGSYYDEKYKATITVDKVFSTKKLNTLKTILGDGAILKKVKGSRNYDIILGFDATNNMDKIFQVR